jgi:hypothetical protein
MTDDRLALAELLEKAGDGDFLRTVAEAMLQMLMEADVEGWSAPGGMSAVASGRPGATATATACSTRAWDRYRSWRRGKSPRRRWSRCSKKRGSAVFRRGGSTTWCRLWGLSGISKS